jgi:uncharacterized protein YeaO (DUF488 family)
VKNGRALLIPAGETTTGHGTTGQAKHYAKDLARLRRRRRACRPEGRRVPVRTFRIGTPARAGDGLRLGVTRRPPRGVPKSRWVSEGLFDVWFPALAPSLKLLERVKAIDVEDPKAWKKFFDRYERELAVGRREAARRLATLAAICARTAVSIGCFCEDESRCHRRPPARRCSSARWNGKPRGMTMTMTMDADEKAIRGVIARWHEATAAGKVEDVLPLMDENVIFLVADKPPMQGRAAFEKGLRTLLAGHTIRSTGDVQEVGVRATSPMPARSSPSP